jgi:hypothetical protein
MQQKRYRRLLTQVMGMSITLIFVGALVGIMVSATESPERGCDRSEKVCPDK